MLDGVLTLLLVMGMIVVVKEAVMVMGYRGGRDSSGYSRSCRGLTELFWGRFKTASDC